MWKELLLELTKDNPNVKLNPPATEENILEVENKLKVNLPKSLKNLLLEFNGDSYFVFSTNQIIENNISIREIKEYMPLDCLLFIAGNGCGDYLGYPITGNEINTSDIFMWDHESDNRVFKANGLKDAIEKYYNDEI
jgi:hypothetical protein